MERVNENDKITTVAYCNFKVVSVEETEPLFNRMGNLRLCDRVTVVHSLAVCKLLATSFIDRFICGILPFK